MDPTINYQFTNGVGRGDMWQQFANANGFTYTKDAQDAPVRPGTLFRMKWFPADDVEGITGVYRDLPIEIGNHEHSLSRAGRVCVTFLRVQLPGRLPRLAIDEMRAHCSLTKAADLADGQWLRPPDELVGKVNARTMKGFEGHITEILPTALLDRLLANKRKFSIEVVQNELYVYYYKKIRKGNAKEILEEFFAVLDALPIERITELATQFSVQETALPASTKAVISTYKRQSVLVRLIVLFGSIPVVYALLKYLGEL